MKALRIVWHIISSDAFALAFFGMFALRAGIAGIKPLDGMSITLGVILLVCAAVVAVCNFLAKAMD